MILADYDHPIVERKARELTIDRVSLAEKTSAIFYYVRDASNKKTTNCNGRQSINGVNIFIESN